MRRFCCYGLTNSLLPGTSMNILVLSLRGPTNLEARGGAIEVIRHILGIWADDGHEVRVSACREPGLPDHETVNGIEVFRQGRRITAAYHQSMAYRRHHAWADVVIENMLELPLLAPFYVRKPFIALVHHLMGWSWVKEVNPVSAVAGIVGEKLILPTVYRRSAFVSVSEATRSDLAKSRVSAKNIQVMPLGVDTQMFKPAAVRTPKPTILYIGRLDDKRKRVTDLFPIIQLVREAHPETELIVAGTGSNLETLKEMAQQVEGVSVVGFVTDEEKVRLLQSSWVHAIPSEREGFGLTALEASMCATPTVAYDAPGLIGVQDQVNGVKVPLRDQVAFAKAVNQLIGDATSRERLGQAAYAFASSQSWQAAADELFRILSDQVERHVA